MTEQEAMEELKTLCSETCYRYRDNGCASIISCSTRDCIDMSIKALEEQDKHRWIPVRERLPLEHDTIFAKFKGTAKWNDSMFEKISDDVNVTVEFENGTRKTMTMHTTDGEWKENFRIVKKRVIAWMEMPEPYKGE